MRYYRDSQHMYPESTAMWKLNDDGSVDYRNDNEDEWEPAFVLTSLDLLEDSLFQGNIEEYYPTQGM